MNPKISIIVPVYNVEPYIRKCVDSILDQTFEDFEVILVDDGSLDRSGAICDEYTVRDSRVRVIHKKNGGLSSARNAGLEIARGSYILFVDSDDWLVTEWLKEIRPYLIEREVDVISFGFSFVQEDGTLIKLGKQKYPKEKKMLMDDFLPNFSVVSNAWSYVFKKEIIDRSELKFTLGILHEDEDFTVRYLAYCKNIVFKSKSIYMYLQRSNSIMGLVCEEHVKRRLCDMMIVVKNLTDFVENKKLSLPCQRGVERKRDYLVLSIILLLRGMSKPFRKTALTELIELGLVPLPLRLYGVKYLMAALAIRMFGIEVFLLFR